MSSYIPIASQTLGSSATSVTFSSIPTTLNGKTLRDLVLVCETINTLNNRIAVRINNNAGSVYNIIDMSGNGSSTSSFSTTGTNLITAANSGTVNFQFVMNFMDYAQTNKHKIGLVRGNSRNGETFASHFRYANTEAVSSLVILQQGGGDMQTGSTFNLFGIEG
jgi:hypothetical protein